MTTKADEFKAKRTADYGDIWEFIDIAHGVDPDAYVHKNAADRPEIVFTDGSTYVIGNND